MSASAPLPTPVPAAATGSADRARRAARAGRVPWVAMYHSVGDRTDDPYRITVTPSASTPSCDGCAGAGCGAWAWASCSPPAPGERGAGWSGSPSTTGTPTSSTNALPLLEPWGCGATLFVLPGRLGGETPGSAGSAQAAAHGGRHPCRRGGRHRDRFARADPRRPDEADDELLRAEVAGSRALLSELSGAPIEGSAIRTGRSTSGPSTPYATPATDTAARSTPGGWPAYTPSPAYTSARTTPPYACSEVPAAPAAAAPGRGGVTR